jgi:hypothetical protein
VVVADPNSAPMYAQRSRRVKTDRRDAEALAQACRLGVRESLVRTRVRWIVLIRSLLRREGWRVRDGQTSSFSERVGDRVRNWACDRGVFRSDPRPGGSFPWSSSGRELHRTCSPGVELERDPTSGPHHEGGQHAYEVAPRLGGPVRDAREKEAGHCSLEGVE